MEGNSDLTRAAAEHLLVRGCREMQDPETGERGFAFNRDLLLRAESSHRMDRAQVRGDCPLHFLTRLIGIPVCFGARTLRCTRL